MFVFVYIHVCQCTQRAERTLESLELELQVLVCHLTWVLGAKFRSSGKAATLLSTVLSPTPVYSSRTYKVPYKFWFPSIFF